MLFKMSSYFIVIRLKGRDRLGRCSLWVDVRWYEAKAWKKIWGKEETRNGKIYKLLNNETHNKGIIEVLYNQLPTLLDINGLKKPHSLSPVLTSSTDSHHPPMHRVTHYKGEVLL